MNAGRATTVLTYLRRLSGLGLVRAAGDADLLERFAMRREEAAFTELVRRHGPMVLGVCRRVLGNLDDAEDAFQATFLVLAARPRAVGNPSGLANWLYGVARRTALRAQVDAVRRFRRDRLGAKPVAIDPTPDAQWHELRPVLDTEVAKLPTRHREAFILCCLEGLTHEEAGRLLGIPGGTVASRLSRARERLRNRLVRRGVTLSAVTALLATHEANAAIAPELFSVLARAVTARATTTILAAGAVSPRVAALTQGVLNAMWMTKIKTVAVLVLAVSAAGFGAGVVFSKTGQPGTVAEQSASAGANDDGAKPPEVGRPTDAPRTSPKPATKPVEEEDKTAKAKEVPPASLDEAQFEVELMKAQLDAKQAELIAAKEAAERAQADLVRLDQLRKAAAISQAEVDTAKAQADAALAQVRIREAEMRVPEVRLRQARHRLNVLRQAQPAPATKPADSKDAPPRTSDAREAVELMEAQVAIQRARLMEAKGEAEAAAMSSDRLAKAAAKLAGTIPEQELIRADAESRTKLAQVHVREAELAEAEVRLKHARRRAEDGGKSPGGNPDAQRIEELQKKIDLLQKELESLKKK
jgi:RNA polymerase sigma factor (sigma-70 family)